MTDLIFIFESTFQIEKATVVIEKSMSFKGD